jgi:hypothetical protein
VQTFGSPEAPFEDCYEAKASGATESGTYFTTRGHDETPTATFCDMQTDGGGWTLVHKGARMGGRESITCQRGAYGRITGPDQITDAKMSDAQINAIKGENGVVRAKLPRSGFARDSATGGETIGDEIFFQVRT